MDSKKQKVISGEFFICNCREEGLLLTNDKETKTIDFALYGHGIPYDLNPSFWSRVKYALYHIKTGKKYTDCVVMDYDKAKELAEWIYLNTE